MNVHFYNSHSQLGVSCFHSLILASRFLLQFFLTRPRRYFSLLNACHTHVTVKCEWAFHFHLSPSALTRRVQYIMVPLLHSFSSHKHNHSMGRSECDSITPHTHTQATILYSSLFFSLSSFCSLQPLWVSEWDEYSSVQETPANDSMGTFFPFSTSFTYSHSFFLLSLSSSSCASQKKLLNTCIDHIYTWIEAEFLHLKLKVG